MPTNWLPWPGKRSTEQPLGSFLGLLTAGGSLSEGGAGVAGGEPGWLVVSLRLRETGDLTFPLKAAVALTTVDANMADSTRNGVFTG